MKERTILNDDELVIHHIIVSDVLAGLNFLKDNTIDIAITSPPYWNQRDYGIDAQIGSEDSPTEYIKRLNHIFTLLLKKMKRKGVFFLNIGDKYLAKYGKSSLGFIPYKLAQEMINSGWVLNEILIWFKPNHMPSSIKNRFVNSYEPVFVFSRNKINLFTDHKSKNKNFTNILKVNLQPTPYKHVAVFPEKLVEELLKTVKLKSKVNILDPFAGSGTTLKVIKKLNLDAKGIMIEKNINYVDIIKERCDLKNNFSILTPEFVPYEISKDEETDEQFTLFGEKPSLNLNNNLKQGTVKVVNTKENYYKLLNKFVNHSIRINFSADAIYFIGSKEFDLNLILDTASLTKCGWVIRNLIIVENGKNWHPLFLIVDDNKKYDYVFNYENLNIKSKSQYKRDWKSMNFVSLKVVDSLHKKKRQGQVYKVISYTNDHFPKIILVKWSDGCFTKEYIITDQKDVDSNLKIKINETIRVSEKNNIIGASKEVDDFESEEIILFNSSTSKNYNGKYLEEKRFNWGASPGARSSIEEEYFSLQRLYTVNQRLVSDYLNLKRIEMGFSKSELTSLFPKNYKHTVGHWLRKDFGGSIPTPEDWTKLKTFLNIEDSFTNYVCKSALKFQTVRHSTVKPPEDFIKSSFVKRIKLLFN